MYDIFCYDLGLCIILLKFVLNFQIDFINSNKMLSTSKPSHLHTAQLIESDKWDK